MKRLLFIAYLFPPIANSGTRRSLEFANLLPDFGWEPIVLTVANPPAEDCHPSLLAEVRPGTRVERAPLMSDVLAEWLSRRLARDTSAGRIRAGLEWRIRRLWNVPDECAPWRSPARQRALEIFGKGEGFDAIYATGWPWTSFLVAMDAAMATRRPYVLDYRDLWRPSGAEWDAQSSIQMRINPYLERRAVRSAAAIVSTTPSLVSEIERIPGAAGKGFCITNGFDPLDFPSHVPVRSRDDPLVITYTGVWRPGYGPDDLYLALRQLKESRPSVLRKLRLVMAGFKPGKAQEFGIAEHVDELGPVAHADAISLMAQTDVLYLPVSTGMYALASLPGKLFEYIGSDRPILASALFDSEVARVLGEVGGACRVAPGDIRALADVLERLGEGHRENLFSPRVGHAVAAYTRRRTAQALAELLDRISPFTAAQAAVGRSSSGTIAAH